MQAELDAVRQEAARTLAQTKAKAQAQQTQLRAEMDAARQEYEKNQVRRREITAALKRTEIALQKACQERDEALRQAEQAQQSAQEAAALRAEAGEKVEENVRPRRFFTAVTQRRGKKNNP